jgi:2-succinyl-6-hydroxy-2,4-cyclohexadiene-1-carboxylate synthase
MNRSVRLLSRERAEPVMIAGYSMGARLAAACVLAEPDLYRSALLISVNPGLDEADEQGRESRLLFDRQWAQRMRRNPWEETWSAWNQQPVLKPGSRAMRLKEMNGRQGKISRGLEGRREAWARAIELWSLGRQPDMRASLLEWSAGTSTQTRPLTIMTGTEDVKFTELTLAWLKPQAFSAISAPPSVRHRHALGAGHRVLQEAPEDIAAEISVLLKQL